ncbi:hypothetical protein DFH09DRAFT_1075744 [Mycena vulgaris]|nr:hypothetical protein DFH09DRAFT_1075744 [Mycena vulgaris]
MAGGLLSRHIKRSVTVESPPGAAGEFRVVTLMLMAPPRSHSASNFALKKNLESLDSQIHSTYRISENKWIMGKPAIVAGVPDGKSAGDYVSIYAPVVGRGDMYKVFWLATLKTGASSQRGFQAPLRQLPAAGPDPGGFPGFFNIHTFTNFM